jgi:hypothetical protein
VARVGRGPPAVHVRPRPPLRRGAAPRHRRRRERRRVGVRACRRPDHLRRDRARLRSLGHDHHRRRLRGHAHASRIDRGREGRCCRRGRRGRRDRSERRCRGRLAVRPPRHPAGRRRAGLRRPARAPTAARHTCAARPGAVERPCARAGARAEPGCRGASRGCGRRGARAGCGTGSCFGACAAGRRTDAGSADRHACAGSARRRELVAARGRQRAHARRTGTVARSPSDGRSCRCAGRRPARGSGRRTTDAPVAAGDIRSAPGARRRTEARAPPRRRACSSGGCAAASGRSARCEADRGPRPRRSPSHRRSGRTARHPARPDPVREPGSPAARRECVRRGGDAGCSNPRPYHGRRCAST